jgi:heptosyltransferase-2
MVRPLIGVMPGAARGPAKRWSAERFAEAARRLRAELGGSVVVMGGAGDAEACAAVVAGVGDGVLNLAGVTTLGEWAALLAECRLVLCNDSGGMHLAAALGVPVVAVFGITDPIRTGPLGTRCRVVQHSMQHDRAVPRESAAARAALAAVTVDEVVAAAQELLARGTSHA